MRLCALSKSYFEQSITELISHIIPRTLSSADHPPGVLPTQGS
jgi:hypothetical protein